MSIDQQEGIRGRGSSLDGEGFSREQMRSGKIMGQAVCLRGLRAEYPQYPLEQVQAITQDARVSGLQEAVGNLRAVGIEVVYGDRLPGELGFLTDNLVSAAVLPRGKEHLGVLHSDTVVAGICFPENLTLQSILPLLVVKELLDTKRVFTAYFAMPVGAYAAAGLPREKQYQEVIGLMQQLFGDKLGSQVFIIPDTREELLPAQELIKRFGARNVDDVLAAKKYPFHNLFRYTETAGYGSDIVLPMLAQGSSITILADYRQFESIHAGIKMAEALIPDRDVRALLYTLVNPVTHRGSIREVSQDDGVVPEENKTAIAETSALFYEAALLFPEETVREFYDAFRNGTVNLAYLEEQIEAAKDDLFVGILPASKEDIKRLEDISIQRLQIALMPLRKLQARRMREEEHHVRR